MSTHPRIHWSKVVTTHESSMSLTTVVSSMLPLPNQIYHLNYDVNNSWHSLKLFPKHQKESYSMLKEHYTMAVSMCRVIGLILQSNRFKLGKFNR